MIRWWRSRKMRWAVWKAASMQGFSRTSFRGWMSIDRQARRHNRFMEARGFPEIIVKSERDAP